VQAEPQINALSIKNAAMAGMILPSIKSSAAVEIMPVMCEVYWPTARNPPALSAPAMLAKVTPRCKLALAVLWGEVSLLR
jgi:hypothetical protein